MITTDGVWTMEGLEKDDERRIKNPVELTKYIDKIGFLPLFKNQVEGFSVEELTDRHAWWGEKREEDPWEWRQILAEEGNVAYGKLFSGKAGFVSKEWYPLMASFRRDGYDYDSRYEDGHLLRKCKNIMDVLVEHNTLPSYELKSLGGFGKDKEKGFDSAITALQMMTYITVTGFRKKRNKKNEEYGWAVADFSVPEDLFGRDYVRSAYNISADQAKKKIISHLIEIFPTQTLIYLINL